MHHFLRLAAAGALILSSINLASAESMATFRGDCVHDKSVKSRFIPIELMLGIEWDGKEEVGFPAVDKEVSRTSIMDYNGAFNTHKRQGYKGPISWTHPGSGKEHRAYNRIDSQGHDQIWTVREDKQAAGRSFDKRVSVAVAINEAKFPLGMWKQGEVREFTRTRYFLKSGKTKDYLTKIRIDKLSCEYNGVKDSLEYTIYFPPVRKYPGIPVIDSYIYSPNFGMARAIVRVEGPNKKSHSNKDRAIAYFEREN